MDVSFLEPVVAATGPFATVCADVTHRTATADAELELRVRGITGRLTEQGAPESVADAVRARLLEGNEGGEAGTLRGRALIVAAGGDVLLDEALVDAPLREVAEWSGTPDLLPVLRQLPGRVPHLVVLADRVGADISVASSAGRPEIEKVVEGEDFQVQKVKVGGWAQLRYQRSAEDQWVENADQVAEQIGSLVRRLQPEFVLLAGDVRARQILADRAGDAWKDLVVSMDGGGRAAGADREPVDRRAAELVAEHEARADAAVVEQVQAAGAHGLAATGVPDVVAALRKGQVETLVLADEPDEESLFVGDSPLQLGLHARDMEALGAQRVEMSPADRALIAAAVASDADVVVLPRAAMPEAAPAAAVLRYADQSTSS